VAVNNLLILAQKFVFKKIYFFVLFFMALTRRPLRPSEFFDLSLSLSRESGQMFYDASEKYNVLFVDVYGQVLKFTAFK